MSDISEIKAVIVRVSDADKPVFDMNHLTWGDEKTMSLVNTTLMKYGDVSTEVYAAALRTVEGYFRRLLVSIPRSLLTDESAALSEIDFGPLDSFEQHLRRRAFQALNTFMFAALTDGEKK